MEEKTSFLHELVSAKQAPGPGFGATEL